MTDNDVIKALECCGDEEPKFCSMCPYFLQDRENAFCQEDLIKASLDLFNRQKAEIKKLKSVIKAMTEDNDE